MIMTAKQFIAKAKQVQKTPTVYMWGTYGKPLTNGLITAKAKQYPKYNTPTRVARHQKLVGKGYSAWDCVGLIKGILWGWEPGKDVPYLGNKEVPDTGSDGMIKQCKIQNESFKTILPGEVVWKPGHIGIYIGDGLVVEATSGWTDNVLTSYLANKGPVDGYKGKLWTRHGQLPWVDYSAVEEPDEPIPPGTDIVMHKVIKGDTPWSLAIKYYKDGSRWPEIMDYNHLRHNSSLYTWQTLKIPLKKQKPPVIPKPTPQPPVTPPSNVNYIIHTVKRGDTPWGLAEQYLGDGRKYKDILKANGLKESENIHVGQKLRIPVGTHVIHKIVRGDTPWGLANVYLGNGNRYREIMDMNGLAHDAHLIVGQTLIIPAK